MMEDLDEVRRLILERSRAGGGNGKGALREWSLALGKNETYLQQFITKGSPRKLSEEIRAKLADIIGIGESELRIATKDAFPKAPVDKIELPARVKVTFHVKEWRKFCEVQPSTVARALNLDVDDLGYLESKPHKFSIEQIETIAGTLGIQFDSMRWNPLNLPAPQPAKGDIAKINKARGRK